MGLSLRGSTSGSIDINPPAVAGNNTITLPGDNGSANQFFRNSTTAGIVTYSSMVEDSSGNIGIGTTIPIAKLDIRGGVTQDGGEENLVVASSDPTNIPSTITQGYSNGTLQVFGGGMGSVSRRGGQIDFIAGAATTDPGTLIFRTGIANGGTSQTERFRIDSSGNVGIGSESPTELLDVAGNTTIASNGRVNIYRPTATATNTAFQINSDVGDTDTAQFIIQTGGNVGIGTAVPSVNLQIQDDDSFSLIRVVAASNNVAGIDFGDAADTDIAGVRYSNTDNFMSLRVNASERMRIDSNGIIYTESAIGQTFYASNNTDLRTQTGGAIDTGAVSIESTTTNTGNRYHIVFSNPNGVVGSIRTNGTATAYITSSDYRLKENITPVADGIDRLKQLKPSRFNFITDPSVTVDGFLAHEVQDVIPEAISGEKDAVQTWEEGENLPDGVSVGDTKLDENGDPIPSYQGIDQSKLVPLLTAALQEAVAKIETLEARLNAAGL